MTTTLTRVATYELKAIKEFTGRDGYGLNANLYRDGKKIASIIDHGDGGILSFEFVDRSQVQEIFDELTALSRSVKPVWMPDDVANADWYVHHLLEVTANNKASKKGVLFRKSNEADVNLFANREVYAIPLDGFTREECLDYLRSKYPAGEVWDIESSTWKEVI